MSSKHTIKAYILGSKAKCPWRITIDGKEDPCNRDFKDPKDIREWFETMTAYGYYIGYELVFLK